MTSIESLIAEVVNTNKFSANKTTTEIGGKLVWEKNLLRKDTFFARAKSDGNWQFRYRVNKEGKNWFATCDTTYFDSWGIAPNGRPVKDFSSPLIQYSTDQAAKVACQRHYDNFAFSG